MKVRGPVRRTPKVTERSLAKRSLTVHIAGAPFKVRSDADETYIRTLAGFVDDKIKEMRGTTRSVTTHELAILAAMNIADDLFQERYKRQQLKQTVRERSKTLLTVLNHEEKRYQRNNH